jgi:hypothetical protein
MWTYTKKSDGTIKLTGYDKTAAIVPKGELIIPDKYDGYVVSEIGSKCLYQNEDIEKISIPTTIKIIDQWAFFGCENLTNLSIAEGVQEIGKNAFKACNIESLVLPESLTKVGEEAFCANSKMKTAIIKGRTEFEKGTFSACRYLETVEFHNAISVLPDSMFHDCQILKNVQFPINVKTLGNYIFMNCKRLEAKIPDTVVEVGEKAFAYCNSLQSIVIPDGITEIKAGTFSYCQNLKNVTIPESVKSIGEGAFNFCNKLEKIVLPKQLTQIGPYAFEYCAIDAVIIPEGVSVIDRQTFWGCGLLQDIYIPVNVKKIEEGAFYNCKSLTNVYFGGTKEMWDKIVIEDDYYHRNQDLTASKVNYHWNQTAASIGY